MSDNVKSPDHYTKGGIETIDYIKAKLSPEEFAGYCKGNVLKYVSRESEKGGTEDLKKARVYLDWLIESRDEPSGALEGVVKGVMIMPRISVNEDALCEAIAAFNHQLSENLKRRGL